MNYIHGSWSVVADLTNDCLSNFEIIKTRKIKPEQTKDKLILFSDQTVKSAKHCVYYMSAFDEYSGYLDIIKDNKAPVNYFLKLSESQALIHSTDLWTWASELAEILTKIGSSIIPAKENLPFINLKTRPHTNNIIYKNVLNKGEYSFDSRLNIKEILPKIGYLKKTKDGHYCYENSRIIPLNVIIRVILALQATSNLFPYNKYFVPNKNEISYRYHPDKNVWKNTLSHEEYSIFFSKNELTHSNDKPLIFINRLIIIINYLINSDFTEFMEKNSRWPTFSSTEERDYELFFWEDLNNNFGSYDYLASKADKLFPSYLNNNNAYYTENQESNSQVIINFFTWLKEYLITEDSTPYCKILGNEEYLKPDKPTNKYKYMYIYRRLVSCGDEISCYIGMHRTNNLHDGYTGSGTFVKAINIVKPAFKSIKSNFEIIFLCESEEELKKAEVIAIKAAILNMELNGPTVRNILHAS